MRGGRLLKHWSCTQKVVTLSSGEAELAGVVKGASEGLGLQSIGLDLGLELALRVHTDSTAAQGICNRSGIGKVRHLAVSQLWVQERLRDKSFGLYKVRGELNPADLLTKHLEQSKIRLCLATMGLRVEAGRPETAPRLAAEVDAFLASVVCDRARSVPWAAWPTTVGVGRPRGPGHARREPRAACTDELAHAPLNLLSATPLVCRGVFGGSAVPGGVCRVAPQIHTPQGEHTESSCSPIIYSAFYECDLDIIDHC